MGTNYQYRKKSGNGSAQTERYLKAASPDSIPLDERGLKEWVDFARRFSAWIRYYDQHGKEAGTWAPFFERDLSAQYGRLAVESVASYRAAISELMRRIAAEDAAFSLKDRRASMAQLFAWLGTQAWAFNQYMGDLPDSDPLRQTMESWIRNGLAETMDMAMGFYKAALALEGALKTPQTSEQILGIDLQDFSLLMAHESWSPLWYAPFPSMAERYAAKGADPRIFLGETDPMEQGRAAVQHNLFTHLFDRFLAAFTQIIAEAETLLEASLTSAYPHRPHYALFLSFLRMSRYQRSALQALGQAHLDFYYKDVLRLGKKEALPHRAHLVLQLARPVDRLELEAGTEFWGGKDREGRDRWFRSTRSTWITQAKLGAFSSIYQGGEADRWEGQDHFGRWFAAPVTASLDGLGKPLDATTKDWHPLVNKTYKEGAVTAVNMPFARLGFAVQSNYLNLAEGKREIALRFVLASGFSDFPMGSKWLARVSTKKGWLDLSPPSLSKTHTSPEHGDHPCIEFRFQIPGSAPGIAAEASQGAQALPVLELILDHGDGSRPSDFPDLEGVRVKGMEIEVSAGGQASAYNQDGLKQLVLLNDQGNLDPTKPFLPFGSQPEKGAGMIIGSPEIFQKPGSEVWVDLEWDQAPSSLSGLSYTSGAPKAEVQFLVDGKWDYGSVGKKAYQLFLKDKAEKRLNDGEAIPIPEGAIHRDPQTLQAFSADQSNGFMRLRLKDGFGFQAYQSALRLFLIGMANKTMDKSDEPQEPYMPRLRSLYLSYVARSWIDFSAAASTENEAPIRVYHLYPFGTLSLSSSDEPGKLPTLIPSFGEEEAGVFLAHRSAFFIQVLDQKPGESLSILFQYTPGSSDPRVAKPANHLRWSYLSGNTWQPFPRDKVLDQTRAGLRAGLVELILPEDAGGAQTLFEGPGIWIRAAVIEAPEALCKLQGLHVQALEVEEQTQGVALSESVDLLPASTITRARTPQPSLRKVTQPYPGFGGRGSETAPAFQQRVSERLRHKDRAITVWDYEHLILEAFPEVHRVKCLAHTRYEGADYDPQCPGNVTLIPLPDLRQRQDIDPRKPYTHQDTLEAIAEYLKERTSAHVRIHVRQPQFEELRLSMKLKFLPGLAFGLYREKLREELVQFLTPWTQEGKGTPLSFGGQVDKSVLIHFIDQRPYVDFVTDLRLFQRIDGAPEWEVLDQAKASTARSILVSAAGDKHEIEEAETSPQDAAADCQPCSSSGSDLNAGSGQELNQKKGK